MWLCSARTPSQPRRQHLLQFRQRTQRRLFHAIEGPTGRGAQAQRDRHGLLVIEQQRGQRGTSAQPVPADRPTRRVHRVAEVAQPLHVVADRTRTDLKPFRQLGARPVTGTYIPQADLDDLRDRLARTR
jgi:hypothetical protein